MNLPGSAATSSLLWLSSWRHACQHPWQTWLNIAGIALGVMMVVAVDLANSSARRAFDLSVATLSGEITHQISGGAAGVGDAVFTGVRTELGLRRSAPTITATVNVEVSTLTLLGLDLLSELSLKRQRGGFTGTAAGMGNALALLQSDAAVLHSATAERLGLQVGEKFIASTTRGSRELTLMTTLPAQSQSGGEEVLFTDIATAQLLAGRSGVIDSIDLVLSDAEAERLRLWLPASLALVAAEARTASLQQMTNAFHTNLLAMSLLALLVAGLLIYNTVSLSVLQRQHTLGLLRSLGIDRAELLKLVLLEVAAMAALAGIIGLGLGSMLGQVLVKLVTRTVDDLYFSLTVTRFLFDPYALLKGWLWGVGVSLAAGALPAWQAAQSLPITLQQPAARASLRTTAMLAVVGVILMLAGELLLRWQGGALVSGFVALTAIVFGSCLLVPLLLYATLALTMRFGRRVLPLPLRVAVRNLQQSLNRPALAVAALAVAVSVTVGVGLMTQSFRDSVVLWLEQSLRGDLLVGNPQGGSLSPAVIATVVQAGSVELQYRSLVESNVGAVSVIAEASDLDAHLYLAEVGPAELARADAGEGVLVSEPLAWQQQLAVGDTVTLYTGSGRVTLPVLGTFHDYTTTGGIVAVSQALFLELWPQSQPIRAMLALPPSRSATATATELRQQLASEGSVNVIANADIRRITLAIFDRTFAITHVLRLLAVVVAFVGILSALLTLQLQRMRDYALLRAAGMTAGETAQIIAAQTLLLGVMAGIVALPLGLVMADVLIDVINRRSFGWSMLHTFSPAVLVQAVLLAVVAAALAGLQPMRQVASVLPAVGLQKP